MDNLNQMGWQDEKPTYAMVGQTIHKFHEFSHENADDLMAKSSISYEAPAPTRLPAIA